MITHYNFMGQNAAIPINDTDLAVMFVTPLNAPGVKIICRASYEMTAAEMGTPYDYPLSSRFDENDAIFVFDNVLIPWENVLLHRDIDKVKVFFPRSGSRRLQVPGLHAACGEDGLLGGRDPESVGATGAEEFRGCQAMVGEAIAWRNLSGGSRTTGQDADAWVGDAVLPNSTRARRTGCWPARVSADQGDHRKNRRQGADLSAVEGARLQESGARSGLSSSSEARMASLTRSASRS